MTTPIYSLWNDGLGDHWASICLLAQLSKETGEHVCFSSDERFRSRHLEILHVLNLRGAWVAWTPEQANARLDGFDVWATEYLPTRVRWHRSAGRDRPFGDAHPGIGNYICTHFEGVSSAENKNPSTDEQRRILEWAAVRQLQVKPLGDPAMPLSRMVELLSRCVLFVGCDSGPSHVAHSVGCPTYLLEYKLPVVTCHRHKAYVRCDGAGHFVSQADNWLHYLRFLKGRL